MKVLLNDKNLNIDYNGLSKTELIHRVRELIGEDIIYKIYLADVEVSLEYFKSSELKVSELDIIKFITKNKVELIEETAVEAQSYLHKLKDGLLETSSLFRDGEIEKANQKYKLCIDGIYWYTDVLNNILSLSKNEELQKEGNELLKKLNKSLTSAMVAAQKNKMYKVADTLEYEVVEFIDKFIIFNETILIKE